MWESERGREILKQGEGEESEIRGNCGSKGSLQGDLERGEKKSTSRWDSERERTARRMLESSDYTNHNRRTGTPRLYKKGR